MGRLLTWKVSLFISLVVLVGFEVIDYSLAELVAADPDHYIVEYLSTAKWLLVGGFAINGVINWLLTRQR